MTLEQVVGEIVRECDCVCDKHIPWEYEILFAGHPGELFNCSLRDDSVSVNHISKKILIWLD